ncbi:MAG: hypothetical protein GXO74_15430 [Calditrichaeota bacterium]|nr:hypothetical protein [Calditrichota bacterium]
MKRIIFLILILLFFAYIGLQHTVNEAKAWAGKTFKDVKTKIESFERSGY